MLKRRNRLSQALSIRTRIVGKMTRARRRKGGKSALAFEWAEDFENEGGT
jgi:hypothetical protein